MKDIKLQKHRKSRCNGKVVFLSDKKLNCWFAYAWAYSGVEGSCLFYDGGTLDQRECRPMQCRSGSVGRDYAKNRQKSNAKKITILSKKFTVVVRGEIATTSAETS
jgi:hypothetical protein